MEEPKIDPMSQQTERVEILINADTGEYVIRAGMVRLSHLHAVLSDLIGRIENNEFTENSHPNLKVYPIEHDDGDILS